MLLARKHARETLKLSNRRDFHEIIYNAKLTPIQMKVIQMRFIDDMRIFEIAQTVNLSETRVKEMIRSAYDSITRILKEG
ncbi:MAG: sigma factor-like helix-turn-helix DNA-binding protein [Anaerovoracaceae bacterium]